MKATHHKYILEFKQPSGTSRGVLRTKETWYIMLHKEGRMGIGECGILRTLSIDDRPDYEAMLQWTCANIHLGVTKLWEALMAFPSIQFGVEMAFQSLESTNPYVLFPSSFTKGKSAIKINGLIWMGTAEIMKDQIHQKLAKGFSCIKMKIGAINFEEELSLLSHIRSQFPEDQVTLRVDANGAFAPHEALDKLKKLSAFDLHSIEQPITQGQQDSMAKLCAETPVPIALDEDLIGVFNRNEKIELLQKIQPQYIILKPSLIGGFRGTQEWIDLADSLGIQWWITSALESNIGLSAIAQYTYMLQNELPQGLGTGSLYTNNIESPLHVKNGALHYSPSTAWNIDVITKQTQ